MPLNRLVGMSEIKILKPKTEIQAEDVKFYIDSDGMVTDQHGYYLCHADFNSLHLWVNVTVVDDNYSCDDQICLADHLVAKFNEDHRSTWEEHGFVEEYADWCTFHYQDGSTENAWQFTMALECQDEASMKKDLAWVFNQDINIVL